MKKVLIVDRVHPYLSEQLSGEGFVCQTDMTFTYDSFKAAPDDLYGLVIRSRFVIDRDIIDSKSSLKFIVRIGSGVENIDVEYAEKKGIKVISTPEGNANAVAEHCLGFLLAALRHLSSADREVRAGEWHREKNKGTELHSYTYGLIGYGHTGPAFAKLLRALGCEVYAYDRYNPAAGNGNAEMTDLDTIMRKCDVISVHVNYIPENKYFIDEKFIENVAKPFVLINTSRGLVVNTEAVVKGLESGKIRMACLDVLEYESPKLKNLPKEQWPAAMERLSQLENVILTPHVGGQTPEAELRHAQVAVERILERVADT